MTPYDDDPQTKARPVDDVAEHYVSDYAAADPVVATFLGIPGFDHALTDLSTAGYEQRDELTRRAFAEMQQVEPSDDREKAARSSFLERLAVEIEQAEARAPQTRISVISSELHNIRGSFDLMPKANPDDWSNISSRLAAIPAALSDYRATLLRGAEDGYVSARRQIAEVAAQVRAWTGEIGGSGSFFTNLAQSADVPDSLAADLRTNADKAGAAYSEFGRFLDDELLPLGRDREGVGREQYERDSRYFLGAEIDLDETYAWGWEELNRIETAMGETARAIAPDATSSNGVGAAETAAANAEAVAAAVAALDSDPARRINGSASFQAWMQDLADRTVAEMADTHFDIPEPVRRIECCLAPTHDGGIYYTGPSEDFRRPGRMWWSVPEGIDDFSTWREVTTVYHEGVPGHHLQVAQTAYRKELLNRWQRTMCWVSGHGEGWALYAERLMDELGYLDDPGDKLGMLDAQGFRAARVVVDIGMHLELEIPADNPFGFHPGETWTPELGLEFMRQHCRMEDAVIRFEVNRYLGWPGQAPSYKVGERIWLQARDEVKQRKGADFDLKAFHRAALDLGSIGLDPLREALARL
ncbi:MAG: hypothetical protein QOI06_1972 [Nocardioidaceae bacterium]|jgi:uncharacterized protein (DUF885 family)|nr:hypothetical protein [Nocardioidaceae bacterium]